MIRITGASTVCLAVAAAVCVGLGACAQQQRQEPPEPITSIPDPVPTPDDPPVIDRPASELDPQDVEEAGEPDRADRIADDGRPAWWFPDVRREGDTLRLCVEAIGTGLREANQKAVEVSVERARLESRRAGYAFDRGAVHIDKAWGWPLAALPGRDRRYAGYALVRIELAMLEPEG